jgi:Cd2+/Zn2+-exporting ATPase
MDCASCARKIETAVGRLDDVSKVKVLFATEKLVVEYSDTATPQLVEQTITATGFSFDLPASRAEQQADSFTPLSLLKQNAQVMVLAGAMAVSALLEPLFPLFSHWAFVAICLLGLLPILSKAVQLTKSGTPFSIETLMSVAALGALYLGESAEAAMVLLLFLLGEKLEAFASGRARSGVKALMALIPETATKIVNGKRLTVPAEELLPEDVIEVAPGDRLPADGVIATAASFDESALTGESVPVEKQAGEAVMAGSVVVDRVVRYRVTSERGENAVDRILHLIEEADSHKAPMERFLDRFSRWYTPLMMVVSLLVIVTPPLLFAQPWETWLYRGLALLLIACPCALVISTPAAITSGLAAASRRGILIKGGAALEQLGRIQMVAFDKPGTLTKGEPQVTDIVTLEELSEQDVLRYAAAIELGSSHPLAQAIVARAQEQKLDVPEAEQKEVLLGVGVRGVLHDTHYKLVTPGQLGSQSAGSLARQIATLESSGKTVTVLLRAEKAIALIALQDTTRAEAAETIEKLSLMGIDSVMLTGDNPRSAQSIAENIGIEYQAGLLPEDKINHMQGMAAGRYVAMVGDGINDAPAMKMASVGIAMGGGSDVALETADAALTHNRLTEVAGMIRLSRLTLSNIRQNVALALGLKGVFLITSVLGITGLWVAVLADSGATVLVTLNALRLLRQGKAGE